jgi:hypothetical protein
MIRADCHHNRAARLAASPIHRDASVGSISRNLAALALAGGKSAEVPPVASPAYPFAPSRPLREKTMRLRGSGAASARAPAKQGYAEKESAEKDFTRETIVEYVRRISRGAVIVLDHTELATSTRVVKEFPHRDVYVGELNAATYASQAAHDTAYLLKRHALGPIHDLVVQVPSIALLFLDFTKSNLDGTDRATLAHYFGHCSEKSVLAITLCMRTTTKGLTAPVKIAQLQGLVSACAGGVRAQLALVWGYKRGARGSTMAFIVFHTGAAWAATPEGHRTHWRPYSVNGISADRREVVVRWWLYPLARDEWEPISEIEKLLKDDPDLLAKFRAAVAQGRSMQNFMLF